MGQPYSEDLRERVVGAIEGGMSTGEAAMPLTPVRFLNREPEKLIRFWRKKIPIRRMSVIYFNEYNVAKPSPDPQHGSLDRRLNRANYLSLHETSRRGVCGRKYLGPISPHAVEAYASWRLIRLTS